MPIDASRGRPRFAEIIPISYQRFLTDGPTDPLNDLRRFEEGSTTSMMKNKRGKNFDNFMRK